jgi:hypothetical protein
LKVTARRHGGEDTTEEAQSTAVKPRQIDKAVRYYAYPAHLDVVIDTHLAGIEVLDVVPYAPRLGIVKADQESIIIRIPARRHRMLGSTKEVDTSG